MTLALQYFATTKGMPNMRIVINGVDQSDALLAMEINDFAGTSTDSVSLTFDGSKVFPIGEGSKAVAYMGYLPGDPHPMGQFDITGTGLSIDAVGGQLIKAKGTCAPWHETFKVEREQHWKNITLGEMITTIATRNGFTAQVDPELSGIFVESFHQTFSDAHLITALANRYTGLAKPKNDLLIFATRFTGRSTTGREINTIMDFSGKNSPYRCLSCEADFGMRGTYKGVSCYYQDPVSKKRKWESVGEFPFKVILDQQFADQNAAKSAAESIFAGHKHMPHKLMLLIEGDPYLIAGQRITIVGLHSLINDEWLTHQINHTIDDSGFKSMIIAERSRGAT